MDLIALADFNLVATHGGFGRASRVTLRPKATLSRHVMALEESLGVRLFERGQRKLRLTEDGVALHQRTRQLLDDIADVGEAISGRRTSPRGKLRISAPVLLSHIALGRVAANYARQYPDVQLEIVAEDRFVRPVEDGYDLVIRTNPKTDEELVGRCFFRAEMVVAAPTWLEPPRAPGPETIPVPAVVQVTTPLDMLWRITGEAADDCVLHPQPVLRLSSLVMVRDAVVAGAGAGLVPRFMIADALAAGQVACWGSVEDKTAAVWALYTSRRLVSRKITSFVQFLCESFPNGTLPE